MASEALQRLLPLLPGDLPEVVRRVDELTEEMLAGRDAEDWGRVIEAEEARRPLIRNLDIARLRAEGGPDADEWLQWLLAVEQETLARGSEIRAEMQAELKQASQGERARRAYEQYRSD